jgi:surface antigen
MKIQILRLNAAIALLLAAASSAGAVQFATGPTVAWPGLSQDDVDRMQAAAARLYEGRSIGTVERWRNPDSKDAGEVKLLRSFESHGMPCRTIDYTVRFESRRNSTDHYVLNWCRVEEGSWKVVELPRQRSSTGR